jgi:CrcB protein
MAKLHPVILISLGAIAGANARYFVGKAVALFFEGRFPLGTFLVNVSGSFLLGFLAAFIVERSLPSGDALRLALGVGFLGAYTTFSTFEYETHALLEDGAWLMALSNMLLSLAVGLVAVRLGVLAAHAHSSVAGR